MNAPKRWRAPDGTVIDAITVTGSGRVGGDGEFLRVRWPNSRHRALLRSVAELAALGIDLAELAEEMPPRLTAVR